MTRAGKSSEPVDCCRRWMELGAVERAQWHWQVIHRLAHSRVTFSLPTLASMARIDEEAAGQLVQDARKMKWVWRPYEGVWVGSLSPSRR